MNNQIKMMLGIFFLISGMTKAQTAFKIKGRVITSANKPINQLPITLLAAKTGAVVKIEFTNAEGHYEFSALTENDYQLLIDDPTYQGFQSQLISLTTATPVVELPTITIAEIGANQLSEVVVKQKKPLVENKIDRTVVHVDMLISAAGGDAMDVLEKSPGISVDQNGTITFKGKSGVQVFIDDKPTYLSGPELEAYLKSLPASTLDKIELMTNPPAKYDAAGGAGIINIVSKRSKVRGFNGNFSSRISQGKKTISRQGLNLNYLNDKVRLFGSFGYATQQSFNDLFIFRKFKNDDQSTKNLFYQYSDIQGRGQTGNVKIGLDYYLSDKTTLGIGLTGILKRGKRHSNVKSDLTDANSVLDSSIIAQNRERQKFSNGGANLNFRHEIDTTGQKITADLDYLKYTTSTDQRFTNFIYQPDESLSSQDEMKGHLPSDIDIYSFKTDYSLPVNNGGQLEAGYKVSYTQTDNVADYRDIVNGNEIPNYNTSNHFKYDEVIHAAYVNFNTNYKRFTFQTGLRLENTESKGNQLGNVQQAATKFKRNYTSLFPTVYVQYKLDSIGNNQLVANYGRRINRPFFQDLNPFVSPLDKFTFYSGNPYLNPSFSDNYELSYRYKSYLSVVLSYGHSKDDINETIEIDNGIYYSRPGNIGKSESFSFQINATVPFTPWWSAMIYNEITHSRFTSKLYTEDLRASGTFWYFMFNNSFKFSKGWAAEINGNYQTDIVSSQFVLLSRSNISVGVQKKILKDKGSLKLSANDIFYSNLNNGIIKNLHNTEAHWRNKLDSRYVALAFTYSFGKSFTPKDQYDANGAESEKNRVKG